MSGATCGDRSRISLRSCGLRSSLVAQVARAGALHRRGWPGLVGLPLDGRSGSPAPARATGLKPTRREKTLRIPRFVLEAGLTRGRLDGLQHRLHRLRKAVVLVVVGHMRGLPLDG